MNGAEAFLEILANAGVPYLFGNPGSTELPLNDALIDQERLRYILGLHEIPVMAMADGYAQASRTPAVVNVHISCGLGNAMGMLYNAHRAGTPLILTAGQQDRRLKFGEPVLWSELVDVARPWTKWAAEVQRAADLPTAVRRAFQIAMTPPTGPVFLSLPVDLQTEEFAYDLTPPQRLNTRVRPPAEELLRAAEILAAAENPAILVGSRVAEADAIGELVAVAERLGTPVISEPATTHGRLGFPCDHPLFAPGLPLWSHEIHDRLNEFDVLLVTGMDLIQLYIHFEPDCPIPQHLRVIQLDQNAREVAKNYPVDVGLIGDPKAGLGELAGLLAAQQTAAQSKAATQRARRWTGAHRTLREELVSRAAAERSDRPMTPLTVMESLARAMPENTVVVEEAVTTTGTVLEQLGAIDDPQAYFAHRGWALGWGLGCALGVQLAWPGRPVLALLGDGAAIYGIQGLWTAARYKIPVTFVVCNNNEYQILKNCAAVMELPHATEGRFQGMDLVEPQIDFLALSESFGVAAERISEPDELSERVRDSLNGDAPRLFEVRIQRRGSA